MMKGNTVFAMLSPRVLALETNAASTILANSTNISSTYQTLAVYDIWGTPGAVCSHQIPDSATLSVFSGTNPTTGTFAMPNSPYDRQRLTLAVGNGNITNLLFVLLNSQTLNNTPTTLTTSAPIVYTYVLAWNKWIKG